LYSASLEELQVNIPDGLFGISAERLKKGIGKLLDFSRRCLPETLKKHIRLLCYAVSVVLASVTVRCSEVE